MKLDSSNVSSEMYVVAKSEAMSLLARCLAVLGRGEKVGQPVRDEVVRSFRHAVSGLADSDRGKVAEMTDGEIWDTLLDLARRLLGDDK